MDRKLEKHNMEIKAILGRAQKKKRYPSILADLTTGSNIRGGTHDPFEDGGFIIYKKRSSSDHKKDSTSNEGTNEQPADIKDEK